MLTSVVLGQSDPTFQGASSSTSLHLPHPVRPPTTSSVTDQCERASSTRYGFTAQSSQEISRASSKISGTLTLRADQYNFPAGVKLRVT